jgi:hypothetical protein
MDPLFRIPMARVSQRQGLSWIKCSVIFAIAVTALLALVAAGCEPGDFLPLATVAPTPTPVRLEVTEIGVSEGEPIKEIVEVNNCKGENTLETVVPATRLYTHELLILPEPELQPIVGRVRTEILDHYQVENPLDALTATCAVPAQVPPRTLYGHEVLWIPIWREGTVEAGAPDEKPEATYHLLESLSCKVVGFQPLPCPSE